MSFAMYWWYADRYKVFEIRLCLATTTLNTHMISRSKGNTINNAIHTLEDTAKLFASTRESTYHITSLACYEKELLQREMSSKTTTKLAEVLAIDLFYVEYMRLLQYPSYLHTYKLLFSTARYLKLDSRWAIHVIFFMCCCCCVGILSFLSPYWWYLRYGPSVPIFSSIIDTLLVVLHHISAYGIVKQHLSFNILHHFCL